jgi:hypothetical protein
MKTQETEHMIARNRKTDETETLDSHKEVVREFECEAIKFIWEWWQAARIRTVGFRQT